MPPIHTPIVLSRRPASIAVLAAALLAGCASDFKPLAPFAPDDPEAKELAADEARFQAKKEALIDEAMDLDSSEHDAFWREYRLYEGEFRKIQDQRYQLIRDYAAYYDNMTNEIADNLAERSLSLKQQRHDLIRKYYQRIKKATSAITAARFLQVENQVNLLSDLKLSSEAPLFPKGAKPAASPKSGAPGE
jgi:hypothetical protein